MIKLIFLTGCIFIVSVDSSSQTCHFLKGEIPFEKVKILPDKDWSDMDAQLYRGYKNGTYWIKIEQIQMEAPVILNIPESHVNEAFLYSNSGVPLPALKNTRTICFQINKVEKNTSFYLKIHFIKEAIATPQITDLSAFYQSIANKNIYLGIYYGIAILVVLFNLFSYLIYRRITYIHYTIMLCFITLGLAMADGFFKPFDNIYIEPFFNLCLALTLPILANSYMDLGRFLPKVNRIGIVLACISVLLFIIYVITGTFLIFAIAQATSLALVTAYWFAGLIIFRKSFEAKIFTIAYFIICFSCYDFYIARSFGFHFIGLTIDEFRIGAILEMIVFTFAINYQGKILAIENQKMLELLRIFSKGEEGQELLQQERGARLVQEFNLTPKEIQVLQLIVEDRINKEIADELNISVNTVKFHVKNIYSKLEISSRQEARQYFYSGG